MWTMSPLYVYLNKHGYNGLSRYNSRGEYNVPWGKRVAPIRRGYPGILEGAAGGQGGGRGLQVLHDGG